MKNLIEQLQKKNKALAEQVRATELDKVHVDFYSKYISVSLRVPPDTTYSWENSALLQLEKPTLRIPRQMEDTRYEEIEALQAKLQQETEAQLVKISRVFTELVEGIVTDLADRYNGALEKLVKEKEEGHIEILYRL